MATQDESRPAFRCPVAPELSSARMRIGRRKVAVTLIDMSRSGFTIQLPKNVAQKISGNRTYHLLMSDEVWEVKRTSVFSEKGDTCLIGVERIRDLTKYREPNSWGQSFAPQGSSQVDPSFTFFLMLAFIIGCLCLPGIGDSLGTAPRIEEGVEELIDLMR